MIDRVRGTIARRLLINFRVDPAIARRQLPPGFELKLADGYAIAGICLIRLEQERPVPLPPVVGISSENAAHRFAAFRVESDGTRCDCVYIARRHTASTISVLLGGRVFPGQHRPARFAVSESGGVIDLSMRGSDGLDVCVRARPARTLPPTSVFRSIDEASEFFRPGSLGYSANRDGASLDGLLLTTARWAVEPLEVEQVASTYFDDRSRFPDGSVDFDCALLMKGIEHEWQRTASVHLKRALQPQLTY